VPERRAEQTRARPGNRRWHPPCSHTIQLRSVAALGGRHTTHPTNGRRTLTSRLAMYPRERVGTTRTARALPLERNSRTLMSRDLLLRDVATPARLRAGACQRELCSTGIGNAVMRGEAWIVV
jgi:hypothetical protein